MRKLLALFSCWLYCAFIQAQVAPNCGYYSPTDPSIINVCNSGDWDWEVETSDPDYCPSWTSFIYGSTNSVRMGAPWHATNSLKLIAIDEAKDYTQENGWRLIKKKFGCTNEDVFYPYFILYNEFTGIIRVYVYMNDGNSYNKAMCKLKTVKSSGASTYTATNSTADEFMLTPKDYKNQLENTTDDQVTSVVSKGGNGWAVTDFNPMFDLNAGVNIYQDVYLNFEIYGVIESQLEVSGTSEEVTEDIRINGQYSSPETVDGKYEFNLSTEKATTGNSPNAYTALAIVGQSFESTMNSFEDPDGDGKDELLAGKAVAKATNTLLQNAEDFQNPAKMTEVFGKTLSGFADVIGESATVLKQMGGFIGMAGSLMGVLMGGSGEAPNYTNATVSRANINLSGTITTSLNVETVNVKLPGTQQSPDNIRQPYYNCPLGLVNIEERVKAGYIEYNRTVGKERSRSVWGSTLRSWSDWGPVKKRFQSYLVTEVPRIVINEHSGATLINAKAALVAKVPMSSGAFSDPEINKKYQSTSAKYHKGVLLSEQYIQKPMAYELLHDILIPANIDQEGNMYVQTPYVDVNCLEGITINAVSEAEVFVRFVIALQTPYSEEPYIYKGDYALMKMNNVPPINDGYTSTNYGETLPPYTNYTEPFDEFETTKTVANKDYPTPWYPNFTCNRCTSYSNGPQPEQSGKMENIVGDLKTSGNVNINEGSILTDVVNSPYRKLYWEDVTDPIIWEASISITLKPGFHAHKRSNFIARIDPPNFSLPACYASSIDHEIVSGICETNLDAWKFSEQTVFETESEINIAPNPTNGNVSFTSLNGGNYNLINTMGEIISEGYIDSGSTISLDLSGNSPGVYYLKVDDGHSINTKKLILQ